MAAMDSEPTSPLQDHNKQVVQHLSMVEIIQGIQGNDHNMQFQCTQSARKLLSREKHPPINDIITSGVIPRLIHFLEYSDRFGIFGGLVPFYAHLESKPCTFDNSVRWKKCWLSSFACCRPEIQFEAAWALTNVASGTSDQTRAVVKHGAVAPFIRLLYSPHPNVAEQAVWALGNIAGDGPELRDHVIKNGCVEPLLNLIKPETTVRPFGADSFGMFNWCLQVTFTRVMIRFLNVSACIPEERHLDRVQPVQKQESSTTFPSCEAVLACIV